MATIDVREFRRHAIDLKRSMDEEEKSIDFAKLKRRIGKENLEADYLTETSAFFVDPTLFALLRDRIDSHLEKYHKPRVRLPDGGDQVILRKPQAKDVLPNRVLNESEERSLRERKEQVGDLAYINPVIPKKRRFLNISKSSPIYRSPAAGSVRSLMFGEDEDQLSYSSSYFGSPSQVSFEQRIGHGFVMGSNSPSQAGDTDNRMYRDTSVPVGFRRLPSQSVTYSPPINPLFTHPSLSELALPTTSEGGLFGFEASINGSDRDDGEGGSEYVSPRPLDEQLRQHPEIPETQSTRVFLEMAAKMDQSPLHILNPKSVITLMPRQATSYNYASSSAQSPLAVKRKAPKRSAPPAKKPNTNREQDTDTSAPNSRRHGTKHSLDKQASVPLVDASKSNPRKEPPEPQVILSIAIYHPQRPEQRLQEFDILGSQTLADLKKAIKCRKDADMKTNQDSTEMDSSHAESANDRASGSCFLVENTFYNDMDADDGDASPPKNPSKIIMQWVKENDRYLQPGLANYTSASMQQTTFEDLKIRLNHPYVYLHQTKCCHLLLIRDIRLQGKNDESDYSAYPRTTYSWRYERHKCTMCTIYPSEYVTMDDYLSGHSPCYWCRHCFFPFHYDKDGKKVGDFKWKVYNGH